MRNYKVFNSLESLYQELETDKNWSGANSGTMNRYPLRFVLFENFSDFREFVTECQNEHKAKVQGIEKWLYNDDLLITPTQLEEQLRNYVKQTTIEHLVIAPFSEVARFYTVEEFMALLKTTRLIEATEENQGRQQRVYVPLIGMQGKVGKFSNDVNIHIWEYKSQSESKNYRLVLTPGVDFGVKDLEEHYTVCHNLKEWVELWKSNKAVKKLIISESCALYHNAKNAQPDNAFDYTICNNAYEFLTAGLGLKIGAGGVKEGEMGYWEQLAGEINIDDFEFHKFVLQQLEVVALNTEQDFVKAWFENDSPFKRWLLKLYYRENRSELGYLYRVLNSCNSMSNAELFSAIATQIFSESYNEAAINQRRNLLMEANKKGVKLTQTAEQTIGAKLTGMAANIEQGVYTAMKYISPLSLGERKLMVQWLGEGRINREEISELYPDLYTYAGDYSLPLVDKIAWVNTYYNSYRRARIGGKKDEALGEQLKALNGDRQKFDSWFNEFKTVNTVLNNRPDIEVYFWVDGLGVDWLPIITKVIAENEHENRYLNEIHLATAMLPTRTENNKKRLESMAGDRLTKVGDLDEHAHQAGKQHPENLIDEIRMVRNIIREALKKYSDKKVAFISDHGMSYLCGLEQGLNLGGIEGDHHGRCAVWKKGDAPLDSRYVILDDNKTICALTHQSLAGKTPKGVGAHGGATPEEVLVPIVIVSNQKNASNYSATLITSEISTSNATVSFVINGLNSIDTPKIIYNEVEYAMHKIKDNIYESEKLKIVDTAKQVTLKIGGYNQTESVVVKTGFEEDDLFNNLF